MIAVVGSRDARIGFRLAGVTRAYKSASKIREENVILIEDKVSDASVLDSSGAVVVKFSLDKNIEEIPASLIKQVIGANVVIK